MDEQRLQKYLNLIEALLNCRSGQEPEILQANSDLIDEGFVVVMEKRIAEMTEGGNQDDADWLQNSVAPILNQLAEELYQQGKYSQAVSRTLVCRSCDTQTPVAGTRTS